MLQFLLAAALAASAAGDCHVGAWRLDDGAVMDIAPAGDGKLRWRRLDGETGLLEADEADHWNSTLGWTGRADGHRVAFGACGAGTMAFDDTNARRIPLDTTATTFAGAGGTRLAGRLLLPPGDDAVSIVVLVHGAELDSALEWDWMQRLLPAAGVGAFVYDKRGTGKSEGTYTQDFSVLADDVVAAAAEARRLAGGRAGRVGLRGASQGGWVAPLAATRAPVDFVVVVFGLAVSPLEEDREAIQVQLLACGHDQAAVKQAWEISDAVGRMVASRFGQGVDDYLAAVARHRDKPWFKDLRGNITQFVLPLTEAQLRDMTYLEYPMSEEERRKRGPVLVVGTPFKYDAMAVLRRLHTPQLWLLGGRDEDAPPGETLKRLHTLQEKGLPITTVLFPRAEHGLTEVAVAADGSRESLRYPGGYLAAIVAFARGAGLPDVGDAVVAPARAAADAGKVPASD